MTTKKRPTPFADRVTPIEDYTRRGPEAAVRRQLNVTKRQPMSLARALGDRAYVRQYAERPLPAKKAA